MIDLNGEWLLGRAPKNIGADYAERPVKDLIAIDIPGDIHLALVRAGIIGDPQVADNIMKLDWVGDCDWWFYRDFEVHSTDLARRAELVFDGLDYLADIWLNGRYLGRHMNVFRPFVADVSGKLRPKNALAIRLSAFRDDLDRLPNEVMTNDEDAPYRRPEIAGKRPYMRKPQYVFGWNWAWRLSTCGILGGVSLRFLEKAVMEYPAVFTESIDNGVAKLRFACEVRSFLKTTTAARLTVTVRRKDVPSSETTFSENVFLAPGTTELFSAGELPDPALWWPREMGEQNLYEAAFAIARDDETLCRETVVFGVRTVSVDESPRETPNAWKFRFMINGEPVFVKGANWVPSDVCPAAIGPEKRRARLDMVAEANMNYLRVWGGGIYEADEFYRRCDELGIMVWQEFMFSCAEYPDFDPDFRGEVAREVSYQIKRLRSRPSIVMWCGNNEIEQQKAALRRFRPNGKYYGELLFKETIPAALAALDPSRPYVESSGLTGRNDHTGAPPTGFYSGVTHIDIFDELIKRGPKRIPSFLGEWYTASPPTLKAIRRFLPPEHWSWDSPIWTARDFVSSRFAPRVDRYIAPLRGVSFEKSLYYFHCLQMEIHKAGVELCRKHLWECSGEAMWMLADADAGFTRAIVDFYGHRKPAFYAIKRASAPRIVAIEDMGEALEIAVVNGTMEEFSGAVEIYRVSFSGDKSRTFKAEARVAANAAKNVMAIPRSELGRGDDTFLWVRLFDDAGEIVSENRFFLDYPINLKIPLAKPKIQVIPGKDKTRVRVESAVFVRAFRVDVAGDDELSASDNWFDVCPGFAKTIEVPASISPDALIFDWENRAFAPEKAIVGIGALRPLASGGGELSVEIFNAEMGKSLTGEARVESPPPWGGFSEAVAFSLSPGTAGVVAAKLPLAPGAVRVEVAARFRSRDGVEACRVGELWVAPPYSLSFRRVDGWLTVRAINNVGRAAAFRVVGVGERPSAGPLEWDFPLEIDAFSDAEKRLTQKPLAAVFAVLLTENQVVAREMSIEAALKTGKTRPFAPGETLTASRPKTAIPVLSRAEGYVVGTDAAKAEFFLGYDDEAFFLDAVLFGAVPGTTAVEYALSADGEFGFETALSLNGAAASEARRRVDGRALSVASQTRDIVAASSLSPYRAPTVLGKRIADNAVLFRHVVPWDAARGGYRPSPGKTLGFAAVFNFAGGIALRVNDGVHGGKDPRKYGPTTLT